MKLSIIIPQYNETEEQMSSLLSMLNMQENVKFEDFEVVICNDHSNCKISYDFITKFDKINIKLMETEQNVGSGLCRQYAVDHSNSEYIWFIDADDMVFSVLTLAKIMQIVNSNPEIDVFVGKFLREIAYDDQFQHDFEVRNDITWVHSKIYKRKFLEDNKIMFPKGIRVNEDSYFNGVIFELEPKKLEIDDIFTIWRANPKSLTRDKEINLYYTGYPDFIRAKTEMLEYFFERDKEKYAKLIVQTLCFFYFQMQEDGWTTNIDTKLQDEVDKMIAEFYLKYVYDSLMCSKECFLTIYNNLRCDFFSNSNYKEKETYEQFYARILEKNKKFQI